MAWPSDAVASTTRSARVAVIRAASADICMDIGLPMALPCIWVLMPIWVLIPMDMGFSSDAALNWVSASGYIAFCSYAHPRFIRAQKLAGWICRDRVAASMA